MIWSLAPIGILAVLVAIDWVVHRLEGRPWAYQACNCLHPDPEGDDPSYMHRCRSCGNWWDVFSGQPLHPPRKGHP